MSDVAQGPGWWVASDGKWYPPEQHPDYVPPPASGVVRRPGWWVATDGKFYPPELHPEYVAASSVDRISVSVGASAPSPAPWATNGSVSGPVPVARTNGATTNGGTDSFPTAREVAVEKVRRLGGLLAAGRLSDSEFQQMRKEILGL